MPSSPEQMRQRAADLRADARHADGRVHYDLMCEAERLEARAREIERSSPAAAPVQAA